MSEMKSLVYILVVFMLLACGSESSKSNKSDDIVKDKFINNKTAIVTDIRKSIDAKKYSEALSKINIFMKYNDPDITKLHKEATELQLLDEMKSTKTSDYKSMHEIYLGLKKIDPKNNVYIEKEKFYKTKHDELKKAQIAKALAKMSKSYDKLEKITWYRDSSSPRYTNYDGFYLYFGKKEGATPWLRLRIQYESDDWLFIKGFSVYVDDNVYQKQSANFERDHDSRIWEWYDENPSTSDLQMIRDIILSKKATIRFYGNQYHDDMTITSSQKTALKNVLIAYEALGGNY